MNGPLTDKELAVIRIESSAFFDVTRMSCEEVLPPLSEWVKLCNESVPRLIATIDNLKKQLRELQETEDERERR